MSDVFREASAYYMVGRPPTPENSCPFSEASSDSMAADACSTSAAAPLR